MELTHWVKKKIGKFFEISSADPTDVQNLLRTLKAVKPFFNNQPDYGHLDFVIGYNAYQRIYGEVLLLLEQHNK